MKKKYILWGLLAVILAAVAFGYKEYNRTRKDSKDQEAKFNVSAVGIIQEFETDEAAATKKYQGKELIIAVTGAVKEVKKDEKGFYTVMLGEEGNMSSVQCAMDTLYANEAANLQPAQAVTIKGQFLGFNKDETGFLGSDVKMNLCVISTPKK